MKRFLAAFAVLCYLTIAKGLELRQADVGQHLREIVNKHNKNDDKPRIFTDYVTHFTAYKDVFQSVCYLEKLNVNSIDAGSFWKDVIRRGKKESATADRILSKIEAWRLAGGRVVDFCRGTTIILLQDIKSIPHLGANPLINEITDEHRLEQRKRISEIAEPAILDFLRQGGILPVTNWQHQRRRRGAAPYKAAGRFRGQTQSQYLSIGLDGQKEGKAEAEATQQSSRALVSGSGGMGQAQSMSSASEGCDGCADRMNTLGVTLDGSQGLVSALDVDDVYN